MKNNNMMEILEGMRMIKESGNKLLPNIGEIGKRLSKRGIKFEIESNNKIDVEAKASGSYAGGDIMVIVVQNADNSISTFLFSSGNKFADIPDKASKEDINKFIGEIVKQCTPPKQ